jgi:putative acetyltransferase
MTLVSDFVIELDDLSDPRVADFLAAHLQDMRRVSPPESVHALDLDGLRQPDVSFWTLWHHAEPLHSAATDAGLQHTLVGSGALKSLSPDHAEIKSMRVHSGWRGRGLASHMLQHLIAQARQSGVRRLSLETGPQPFFEPARLLYMRHGFTPCPPFGTYREDPYSCFFTRTI